MSIGQQLIEAGQYEAAKRIGHAIARDPQSMHSALALIADACASSGDLSGAQEFYGEAIASAVRGGHFAEKIKLLQRIGDITAKVGQDNDAFRSDLARDKERIAVVTQSQTNLYRMIRNVLWEYGFEDTLVQLFDRVPAVLNDMSWRHSNTPEKQEQAKSRGVPAVCINSLPKSGTMFLLNSFSRALDAPFVRITAGLFPEDRVVPSWADFFCGGGCVSVQHMDGAPRNLAILHRFGLDKVWAHVRDPRQTLVSMFHHTNSGNPMFAADIGADYFRSSVEERVEHHIGDFPKLVQWIRSWKDAAENTTHGLQVLITRHEDLRRDVSAFFDRACAFFEVDRRLFTSELIAPPRRGDLHFRKGEADEWRRVFSAEQRGRLNAMLPDDLLEYFGWQR